MLREFVTVPEPAREPMVLEYPLRFNVPLTARSLVLGNAFATPKAIVPELPMVVAPV